MERQDNNEGYEVKFYTWNTTINEMNKLDFDLFIPSGLRNAVTEPSGSPPRPVSGGNGDALDVDIIEDLIEAEINVKKESSGRKNCIDAFLTSMFALAINLLL